MMKGDGKNTKEKISWKGGFSDDGRPLMSGCWPGFNTFLPFTGKYIMVDGV